MVTQIFWPKVRKTSFFLYERLVFKLRFSDYHGVVGIPDQDNHKYANRVAIYMMRKNKAKAISAKLLDLNLKNKKGGGGNGKKLEETRRK